MTKRYLIPAMLTLLVYADTSFCMNKKQESDYRMLKAGTGLAAAACFSWAGEKASQNERVQEFAKKVGTSPKDVGNVLGMASGMFALSVITDQETGKGLRNLSWRAPIAAAVAGIVCTKTFLDIASYVPVVGKFVSCDNKKCVGICDECRLTKTTIAIGVYRAVDFGLTVALPDATNNVSAANNQ